MSLDSNPPKIDFWYEFASTYSYLSAMRIEKAADAVGVGVNWRPFLLGPIFHAQGLPDSPFNIYEAKGNHMWRDMERQCHAIDLKFQIPEPFPQNSLLAARIATAGAGQPWQASFSKGVYLAEFAYSQDISDPGHLSRILESCEVDPDPIMARAAGDDVKAELRRATQEAGDAGVFGAPSFLTRDGELFWGNDRLEQALDWALADHRKP